MTIFLAVPVVWHVVPAPARIYTELTTPSHFVSVTSSRQADRSGLQLPRPNLVEAQLMGAFLVGSYLTDSDLTHATLADANASGVNLYNASMYART